MDINIADADVTQGQQGVLGILVGTLVKPRATMPALNRVKWSWWSIPALPTLVVAVLTVVSYSYSDCRYIYRLEVEHYASSTDQTGRPPEPITRLPVTMTVRAIGRVVSTALAWVAWSGALYLAMTLLGHNGIAFGSTWTLVLWAWLPHAVRGTLQSIYMTVVGRPIYNQELSGLVVDNTPPPMMTFHYVIPTTNQQALASLLARLDIYVLWQLALMVVGITALTRLSSRKAIGVVPVIWLTFTIVVLIPASTWRARTSLRWRTSNAPVARAFGSGGIQLGWSRRCPPLRQRQWPRPR